jgi:hypothetical protein
MNRGFDVTMSAMKRMTLPGMGLLCLALSACVPELGEPFELRGGGHVTFPEGLRVAFVAVLEDSRCPRGAMCIWEGQARISLEAQPGDAAPVQVELSTLPDKSSADVGDFRIRLQKVAPYPELSKPMPTFEQYTVTLLVTARAEQGTSALSPGQPIPR